MNKYRLDIIIDDDHPAYLWAKKQSNSVNAFGHIGTHIDCYSTTPDESYFVSEIVLIVCTERMPSVQSIKNIDLKGKALLLYTGALNIYGYGTKEYGEAQTFLSEDVLNEILIGQPRFILIDACGIGTHGEQHIRFDKMCENHNCFVIENILLNDEIVNTIQKVEITVDLNSKSTGKLCKVNAIC